MTELRFDMHRIGQTIARLRREQNMTQMALADRMNVSYQAVSNWERGQSMPDVSKLPELAEILGTSIDELLGRSAPLITHAAEGTLEEFMQAAPVTVEEVAEAAPILKPEQVEQLTDSLLGLTKLNRPVGKSDSAPAQTDLPGDVRYNDLTALLPFLSAKKVDLLLHDCLSREEDIRPFLPFASDTTLEALAREAEANRNRSRFLHILPFLRRDVLDEIALTRHASGESINDLAPFLCSDTLSRIVIDRLHKGESIRSLLPFVSQSLINQLADLASKS